MPKVVDEKSRTFAFRESEMVVRDEGGAVHIPPYSLFSGNKSLAGHMRTIDLADGNHGIVFAADDDFCMPRGCTYVPLRALFQLLSDEEMGHAGRAYQILHWEETHRFCGRCGGQTVDADGELAKRCPDCGLLSFPRISPAIIVAVRKGRQLLLVRAHRHKSGVYSNVAGFVEPGETLEDAVRRELAEEVAISVRNIRYYASQPWPFPHSLMVGFTAEYESGEISPYEREIADAQWFDMGHLPQVPDHFTIARRLIDHVVGAVGIMAGSSPQKG